VYNGLQRLPGEWEFALIRYYPAMDEAVKRYTTRHAEPLAERYGDDDARKRAHAEEHIGKSHSYFVAPTDDERVTFKTLATADEVTAFLKAWHIRP
jgi:hypothetical protein